MNLPIPTVIAATLSSALTDGCDCVMPLHDGWPILVNCIGDGCNILSALTKDGPIRATAPMSYKDLSRLEMLDHTSPTEPLSALFVGARSRISPIIYIYDMWWFDNQDIQMHSYRERYALARSNVRKLDERFKMITVSPIQAAMSLWSDVARDTDNFKGLVCRRSKDNAAGELYVIRYYPEQPRDINAPSLLDIVLTKEVTSKSPELVVTPYLTARAHQFLYYVLAKPVLEDVEFDAYCKLHKLELPVGSDSDINYTYEERMLAHSLKK